MSSEERPATLVGASSLPLDQALHSLRCSTPISVSSEKLTAGNICPIDGQTVPDSPTRPRIYCSGACRRKAERLRESLPVLRANLAGWPPRSRQRRELEADIALAERLVDADTSPTTRKGAHSNV
jgi:hypothetical protein